MSFLPRSLRALGIFLLLLGAVQVPAGAVVIVAGDNTTDPGTFPWNNVGTVNGASTIYLGDIGGNGSYWVLTAYHAAASLPGTVQFNGTGDATLETYNTVPGSYVRITNDSVQGTYPGTSPLADMAMFRVDVASNPTNLQTLAFSTAIPGATSQLYLAGYGGGTKRWGTNMADVFLGLPPSRQFVIDDGYGQLVSYATAWNTVLGGSEAQAISGDSGGGVFQFTGGIWQLTGMMYAVDAVTTPNRTFIADLSAYRGEIVANAAAVPEPSTVALMAFAGVALAFRLRRRAV